MGRSDDAGARHCIDRQQRYNATVKLNGTICSVLPILSVWFCIVASPFLPNRVWWIRSTIAKSTGRRYEQREEGDPPVGANCKLLISSLKHASLWLMEGQYKSISVLRRQHLRERIYTLSSRPKQKLPTMLCLPGSATTVSPIRSRPPLNAGRSRCSGNWGDPATLLDALHHSSSWNNTST